MPDLKTDLEQALETELQKAQMELRERDYGVIWDIEGLRCLFERFSKLRNHFGIGYKIYCLESQEYENKEPDKVAEQAIKNKDYSLERITLYCNWNENWEGVDTSNVHKEIGQKMEADFYSDDTTCILLDIIIGEHAPIKIGYMDPMDVAKPYANQADSSREQEIVKRAHDLKIKMERMMNRFEGKFISSGVSAHDVVNAVADLAQPGKG